MFARTVRLPRTLRASMHVSAPAATPSTPTHDGYAPRSERLLASAVQTRADGTSDTGGRGLPRAMRATTAAIAPSPVTFAAVPKESMAM